VSFGEGSLESSVRLGYGGVVIEWVWRGGDDPSGTSEDPSRGTEGRLSLLAGAGNAELRQPVLGIRLESDNFVVLEPGVALGRRLLGRLSLGASARYRLSFAVDDLGGIDGADLSGLALGLELRLGPF